MGVYLGLEGPRTLRPRPVRWPTLGPGEFSFPLASGLEFSAGILGIFWQGFKPRGPVTQHFVWQDGRGHPAMLGDFLVVNAILGGNQPLMLIPIRWKPVPDARSNKLDYCA